MKGHREPNLGADPVGSRSVGRTYWPASTATILAAWRAAGGAPLTYTELSRRVREAAGRKYDPAGERFSDVKTNRALLHLRSRGWVTKVDGRLVLTGSHDSDSRSTGGRAEESN
jgi:hypothetical protein